MPPSAPSDRPAAPAARQVPADACGSPGPLRSPLGTFVCCPLCDGTLVPEHAHFRCPTCGWRDSCCD